MKRALSTIFIISLAAAAAFAQTDEQQLMKIHASLDEAYLKSDIAAFERIMADDYVYSSPAGKMMTREENLADLRKEIAKPTFKVLTATSDGLKVKVSGNMAVVTGNWASTTTSAGDIKTDPHKDMGRYTGVYEKRNGKWMLVAEHFSEAPHDRKLMEQEVLKASSDYTEAMNRRDKAAFERILADDYFFTNEEGMTRTKAEDIAKMTSADGALESLTISDQKIRILSNGSAVETGMFKAKGTNKGKAFDETGRYTTTWVWRGGRWQIAADHTSLIKQ